MKCPACEFATVKTAPTKTGGFSISCPECGFQGFAKSPKAADGVKKQIGGSSGEPVAPAASKKSDLLID